MIKRLLGRLRGSPSCGEVMEVLQAYLDGEVDVDTARMVAGHLGHCTACSGESEVYEQIKVKLASGRREIDPQIRAALEAYSRDLRTASD